ncbi:MAG: hypothetical protein QOE17_784 [Gaiellales bacterium]|jgi:hypothetical protein|nr:hypothetical protein [Gaiellales bacterium]
MAEALVLVVDPDAAAPLVADALATAAGANGHRVEMLIPLVIPSTLPIGAELPGVAGLLNPLREAAVEAMWAQGISGRAEIAPCRSLSALIEALEAPARIVLLGAPDRRLRRALRHAPAELITIPTRPAQPRARLLQRRPAMTLGATTPAGPARR